MSRIELRLLQESAPISTARAQRHPAGEKLFVDYSGKKVDIIDPQTGEVRSAELFVAVLGASSLTYADLTWTQTLPDWIGAHVRMLQWLGKCPKLLIPDNLKSAVHKPSFFDPEINLTYGRMADHFGIGILPARPYRPRDKAKVEAGVRIAQTYVLALALGLTLIGTCVAPAPTVEPLPANEPSAWSFKPPPAPAPAPAAAPEFPPVVIYRQAAAAPTIIAEGYATAADLHEATGLRVIVAFDAGNLEPVAAAMRRKWPDKPLVIAADDDHKLEAKVPSLPNTGIVHARQAAQAVDGRMIVPPFSPAEKTKGLSDYNDLKQERGKEALADILAKQLQAEKTKMKNLGSQRLSSMVL